MCVVAALFRNMGPLQQSAAFQTIKSFVIILPDSHARGIDFVRCL